MWLCTVFSRLWLPRYHWTMDVYLTELGDRISFSIFECIFFFYLYTWQRVRDYLITAQGKTEKTLPDLRGVETMPKLFGDHVRTLQSLQARQLFQSYLLLQSVSLC